MMLCRRRMIHSGPGLADFIQKAHKLEQNYFEQSEDAERAERIKKFHLTFYS